MLFVNGKERNNGGMVWFVMGGLWLCSEKKEILV